MVQLKEVVVRLPYPLVLLVEPVVVQLAPEVVVEHEPVVQLAPEVVVEHEAFVAVDWPTWSPLAFAPYGSSFVPLVLDHHPRLFPGTFLK